MRYVIVLLLAGCATPHARARQMGCEEACAGLSARDNLVITSSWPVGESWCACKDAEDRIHVVCRRPTEEECR
ncbi:MAG: hypothetical protein ACXVCX_21460 [Ktedonobacterales bacterium]